MAINKNHEFEELDGVKCAIVEKNVPVERVEFLKQLLEFNKYTVVVVAAAPPKPAPVAKAAVPVTKAVSADEGVAANSNAQAVTTNPGTNSTEPTVKPASTETTTLASKDNTSTPSTNPTANNAPLPPEPPPAPTQFTIGVTDVTFNPINAIFGRLLKTPNGRIVTLQYWQQKEPFSNDEVPYFAKK